MRYRKNKVGVVLSGGGVRAIECHSGMLDGLKDCGINIEHGYGCSGGAITGSLFFSGINLLDYIRSLQVDKFIQKNSYMSMLFGKPIYDTSNFKAELKNVIGDNLLNNFMVNMTDVKTGITLYTPGTYKSTFASACIPEVFSPETFDGGPVFSKVIPKYDGLIECKRRWVYDVGKILVVDGGVYDNIPVPEVMEIDEYKHLFILVCNLDTIDEEIHQKNRVGRVLGWINETMEREFRQIVNDFGGKENVTIMRPPPFRSSILDWSTDYSLYFHAYNYARKIVRLLMENKIGDFLDERENINSDEEGQ